MNIPLTAPNIAAVGCCCFSKIVALAMRQACYTTCTCHAALRVGWSMSLEIDPSRAHNQLCLINDFRNVPGNDRCNVVWLEVEDR